MPTFVTRSSVPLGLARRDGEAAATITHQPLSCSGGRAGQTDTMPISSARGGFMCGAPGIKVPGPVAR